MQIITQMIKLLLIGCLVFLIPGVALGSESPNCDAAALELTLDQAVEKAFTNSKTLKIQDYDVEISEEVRTQAGDAVSFFPVGPAPETSTRLFNSLIASDLALQISKKTRESKADILVTSVFSSYTKVLFDQEKVAAAEKALRYAEWQQMVARVGYTLGTVSLSGKTLAEAGYEVKKSDLEAANVSLIDSYQKFNNLVGLNPEDRPVLKDDPQAVPLKIENDLETEVRIRVQSSPGIYQAEKSVDIAKVNLDLYNWASPTRDPYKAVQIEVQKAEMTAVDSKEQFAQQVRTLYQGIRQMEENLVGLEQSLKVAEENLRIERVRFDVGMATSGDVIGAENDVASAKLAFKSLTYQHELYKMYFNKPWTLIG